jgi:tetratricopeptide (TPR) repeat protein
LKSADCFSAALEVYKKETYPAEWATATSNLATAWLKLGSESQPLELEKAIAGFKSALTVYTRERFPAEWARAQLNLAFALSRMAPDAAGNNARKALEAIDNALTVYTREAYPVEWAHAQQDLATAWSRRVDGDRTNNYRNACAAMENVSTVLTRDRFPMEWAATQINMAKLLETSGPNAPVENQKAAIERYKDALLVYTTHAAPDLIGETWIEIGDGYLTLGQLGTSDSSKPAIEAYDNAIKVLDPKAFRLQWIRAMASRAHAYATIPGADDDPALRAKACTVTQQAIDAMTDDQFKRVRVELEVSLSWFQLVSKDFAAALATTERDEKGSLPLQTNRAHALLLSGRISEAKAIYLGHVGEDVKDFGRWETVILQDFDSLEKKGLGIPEMAKIRAELVSQSTSRPVARSG